MTGPTDEKDQISQRISRIATQWSLVLDAHSDSDDESASARQFLFSQYNRAVYRYLLGAVRDADVAEELSQEFALRLLRGDFHRANPERGRFRDFVKTVLINLANDHFRSQKRWPKQLSPQTADPAVYPESCNFDVSFEECLSDELMNRTWSQLENDNPRYHAVLLFRVSNPDLSSREMADELNQKLEKPLTPATVRKTLERARLKFADVLLDIVAQTLDCPTEDRLRTELKELNLLKFCRSALERRN